MFLAGMIIGVTLGVLLIRLHKLLNEMDADANFGRRNEKLIIDIFEESCFYKWFSFLL